MADPVNGNGFNGSHGPGHVTAGAAAPHAPAEPPVPKPPTEVLQRTAIAKDGRNRAAKLAQNRFDADPGKAQARAQAEGVLATIVPAADHLEKLKQRYRQELETTDPFVTLRNPAAANLTFADRSRHLPLVQIGMLVLTVVASLINGFYFIRHSGFEFSAGLIDALGISAIFSLAPTILAKYTLTSLTDRLRRRVELVLKCAALPTAALALGLFAVVFGNLMEPFDLLAPAAERPWQAPISVVLGASMALDALASTALVGSIHAAWRMQFPDVLAPSPAYATAERALAQIVDRLGKYARDRAAARAVVERLNAERTAYLEECLVLVDAYRDDYLAELRVVRLQAARAKSDLFKARVRGGGPPPYAAVTTSSLRKECAS